MNNVKTYSEGTADDPSVYESFLQRPVASFSLMVRTSGDPNGLISAMRNTLSQVDGELPLSRLMSMPAVIDRQKGGNSFFTDALSAFAVLALLLAAMGSMGLWRILSASVRMRSEFAWRWVPRVRMSCACSCGKE